MEKGKQVFSVDVAPDCTKFATGTDQEQVTIWSITTGEKILGTLKHDGNVRGVKFSPDGGRLATACSDSTIRIFDVHNGDQLISIENPTRVHSFLLITWSTGQRLFAVSEDYHIRSFDSSAGSLLAEWQIHESSDGPMTIALSTNGKFVASSAGRFVSFWDVSTHTQLGIEETADIQCIALSPDGCHLAAGSLNPASSIIWDVRDILPDSCLPRNVSTPFLKSTMTFIYESLLLYIRKSLVPSCIQNGELIPIDV